MPARMRKEKYARILFILAYVDVGIPIAFHFHCFPFRQNNSGRCYTAKIPFFCRHNSGDSADNRFFPCGNLPWVYALR